MSFAGEIFSWYNIYTKEVILMFKKDDTVLYAQRGVCKIVDADDCFYTLCPIYSKDILIKVPITSDTKMRKILSKEEIDNAIQNMAEIAWIENDKARQTAFRNILSSADRKKIIGLIRIIFIKQQELRKQRKKLHIADERIFKEAEALLYNEFAFVLNLNRESIVDYIAKKLT